MKNLLFIPCYRCAPQITRVLDSLSKGTDLFDEILVIDNLSPDGTDEVALDYVKKAGLMKVKVMSNPANIGLGGSHKLAFGYAIEHGFDHVVILHGDDQGNLHDFYPVLKEAQGVQLESFHFGARFHPSSKLTGYSLFRIVGNIVFNIIASLISKKRIYDLGGSGLNLFPVKLLKEHRFNEYANDLTFHVFLLLNSFTLKQKIKYIPISWREDDQISNAKLFSQSVKLLKILWKFCRRPDTLLSPREVEFVYTWQQWKINN